MYNNQKLFSMFFLAGLTMFTACGDKDENPEDSNGKEYVAPSEWAQGSSKKYVENPDSVQSVKVQQSQLEATGIALATHHKSANFKDIIELARFAYDNYIDKEGYSDSVVSNFFDNTLDLIKVVNPNPVKEEPYHSGYVWEDWIYDNVTGEEKTVYNVRTYDEMVNGYFIQFFQAAKFYGHFQASDNGWIQEPGNFNDLQFTFNDKNGKPCVLKAKVSGNEQSVLVTKDNSNWELAETTSTWVEKDTVLKIQKWDYEKQESYYEPVKVNGYNLFSRVETYDVNNIKVSVPEYVNFSLTQDGNELISSEININLAGIEDERININKTKLGFSTKNKIGPWEFVVNKFDYKNGDKTQYSIYSTMNNKKLFEISGEFLSEINYKGDQKYEYIEELFDDAADDYNSSVGKFTGVVANVNILGEVQVKAAISDAKKVANLLEEAEDLDEDEAAYKAKIDEINKYINMGLYYYGGSKLQAKVRLEAFEDEEVDWVVGIDGTEKVNTTKYWYPEAVIEFEGGQTYSMEEFFNENDFRSLVDLAKEIGEDYEDELDF